MLPAAQRHEQFGQEIPSRTRSPNSRSRAPSSSTIGDQARPHFGSVNVLPTAARQNTSFSADLVVQRNVHAHLRVQERVERQCLAECAERFDRQQTVAQALQSLCRWETSAPRRR